MAIHPEMPQKYLDTTGFHCPQPIMRCRAALAYMRPGQVLHLVTTDPGSACEIRSLIERGFHRLVNTVYKDNAWHFYIEKTRSTARRGRYVKTIDLSGACLMPC